MGIEILWPSGKVNLAAEGLVSGVAWIGQHGARIWWDQDLGTEQGRLTVVSFAVILNKYIYM